MGLHVAIAPFTFQESHHHQVRSFDILPPSSDHHINYSPPVASITPVVSWKLAPSILLSFSWMEKVHGGTNSTVPMANGQALILLAMTTHRHR
jgi:hypothetical protein